MGNSRTANQILQDRRFPKLEKLRKAEKKAADAYEKALETYERAYRSKSPRAGALLKKAEDAEETWRASWDDLQDEQEAIHSDPYIPADELPDSYAPARSSKLLEKLQERGSGMSAKAHYKKVMQKLGPTLPQLDPTEYPAIIGMEGPFRFRSGRVLYYDPKEGAYYDRKRDMYLPRDVDPMRESREALFQEIVQEAINWKKTAQRLLSMTTGTTQFDFGYRAYLRELIGDRPAQHITKMPGEKGEGARQARQDLIDLAGVGTGHLREAAFRGKVIKPGKRAGGPNANNLYWVDFQGARGVVYSAMVPQGVADQLKVGDTWRVSGNITRGGKGHSVVTNVDTLWDGPKGATIYAYKHWGK